MRPILLILAVCLLASYTSAKETMEEPQEAHMGKEPTAPQMYTDKKHTQLETLVNKTKDWNGVMLDNYYAYSNNVYILDDCWKLCASENGCIGVSMGPIGSTYQFKCYRYKLGSLCKANAGWRTRVLSSISCSK
jgi:hypothetical protein